MKQKKWLIAFISLGGIVGAIFFAQNETLLIPVEGIKANQLVSTFLAPRGGGRRHQGVDIFAQKGRAILASHDAVIIHHDTLSLGGKSLMLLSPNLTFTYYAHLNEYDPQAPKWSFVRKGQRIGFVGNTGNAKTTKPHLHFSVRRMKTLWRHEDPVPLLGGSKKKSRWAKKKSLAQFFKAKH